jgi:hypothetical protein
VTATDRVVGPVLPVDPTPPPDNAGARESGVEGVPESTSEPTAGPGGAGLVTPGPRAPDVADAVAKVLKIVGAVVAPTTLLTGLLLYFGRQHATALFDHFGIPSTVFELTPQDYLVRSADGLFVPLALGAGTVLVILWTRGWVVRALSASRRRAAARRTAPLIALVGLVAGGLAVAGVLGPATFAGVPELPGLLLAGGALLLAAAVHLVRGSGDERHARPVGVVTEWAAVFVLVAVGLFWAVGNYAGGVGRSRAVQIEQQLAARPDATLFSEKRLALGGVPGVSEYVCADDAVKDDSAYRFRYDGLKLVFQSGGQYLFLPTGWSHDDGPALVIPRTDSLRLEFSAPGRAQVGIC